jgi:DNA-binding response OmpR family regulator
MKPQILVVDRDIELARLYCGFLSEIGYSCETAERRDECLDILRRQSPEILILDRENPHCDAKGIIHRVRKEALPVSVILTTWIASPESIPRLVVPPVALCLRKFFALPRLLDSVRLTTQFRAAERPVAEKRLPRERARGTLTASPPPAR